MIAALLLQASAPAATAPADEVVVVARQQRCSVSRGGIDLSGRALARLEARWAAGQEVRIHVSPEARTRCLARIMFRLADRGVTRVTFVDDQPTAAPR